MKQLLVFEKSNSWTDFLQKYCADLPVQVSSCNHLAQAPGILNRMKPIALFTEAAFLNLATVQKLKVRKYTDPSFRVYTIGEPGAKKDLIFDGCFPAVPDPASFDKQFGETLPMPETIRLLIIDDEEEVASMIRDYFEGRTRPSFVMLRASNGKEGLEALKAGKPDLIILDIKMPVMDGREFYERIMKDKLDIPVVIFFDAISGEEMKDIRRFGNPPVVEKGTRSASLPALMSLVKKMVFFSGKN